MHLKDLQSHSAVSLGNVPKLKPTQKYVPHDALIKAVTPKIKSHITNKALLSSWPKCLGERARTARHRATWILRVGDAIPQSHREGTSPKSNEMAFDRNQSMPFLLDLIGQVETMGDRWYHSSLILCHTKFYR